MKISYASTVATLALVAATAGAPAVDAARSLITGFDIRDNSIRSIDLANNEVRGVDIANSGVMSADIRDGQIRAVDLSPQLRARLNRADQAFIRVDYGGDPVILNEFGEKTSTCPAGAVAVGGAFTALDDNYPTNSTYFGTNAWRFGAKRLSSPFGSMSGRAICLGR